MPRAPEIEVNEKSTFRTVSHYRLLCLCPPHSMVDGTVCSQNTVLTEEFCGRHDAETGKMSL